MRCWRSSLAVTAIVALFSATAPAQVPPPNLSSTNGYQPIPNYTGNNAGLQFREAINDRFSGAAPTSPKVVSVAFASLATEQDGQFVYCTDCRASIPCSDGGSGAWAFGTNGQWSCESAGIPAVNASDFAGSDIGAKLNNAIASHQCANGCDLYAGIAVGSVNAVSAPIQINRNFITLHLDGILKYNGPAVANGLLQIGNTGATQGDVIVCDTEPLRYDVPSGTFPGGCGIDYEPSSGSGPVATIGNQTESFTIRNVALCGNNAVTDGIDVQGTSPNGATLEGNAFVGGCGGSNPNGTAVTTTNAGGGGAYDRLVFYRNRVLRWGKGLYWYANTGGAGVALISHNQFTGLSGTGVYLYNCFDATVDGNFIGFPIATNANQIDYQFDHCIGGTFTNNHDESNDISRAGGVVQMGFAHQQGAVIAGNTLNGNTSGDATTQDADCLDIDATSSSITVVGNRCGGSSNGFLRNAGTNILYGPNFLRMPPGARELITGIAGLQYQLPVNSAWEQLVAGGSSLLGQTTVNPISNPSVPTVTPVGATGSTPHDYYVDCMDYNGGYTLPSAAGHIANANAVLSSTNYNTISWNQIAGCKTWHVMRDGTSGSCLVASVNGQAGPGATLSVNDTGAALGSYAAAARSSTGDLRVSGRIQEEGDVMGIDNGVLYATTGNAGINGGAASGDISLGRSANSGELFFGYGAGSSHLDYGLGTAGAFTFGADVYGSGILSAAADVRARNGYLSASTGGGANGGTGAGDLSIARTANTAKAFFGYGAGSSYLDYGLGTAGAFTFGADVYGSGVFSAAASVLARNGYLSASTGGGANGGTGAGDLSIARTANTAKAFFGYGSGSSYLDYGLSTSGVFTFGADVRTTGNILTGGYVQASNGPVVASAGGGSSGGATAGMLNTAMAAAAGRTIYGNGTGQARIDFGNDRAGQFYFSAPVVNSCSGIVAMSAGSASVTSSCLSASRPIICTEANTTAPNAIGCSISGTTLSIKSASGSDASSVSWWN